MTTSNQSTHATLQQQIESLQAQLAEQLPAEVLVELSKSITTLVQTGIAQQSVKVGERVPDFTLPDVSGTPVTLSELLKHGPVVLTFYRGEWCPWCNLTLRAYQRILPQIRALGASLVAVSPQTPEHSLSTVVKKEFTFPFSVMSAISWPASTVSSSRWSRPSERSTRPLERTCQATMAIHHGSCRCQQRFFSRRMERFVWPLLMKISPTGWNQRPCSMVCGLWGAMGQ